MTAPRKQAPEDGLTSPSFGVCLLIRGGLELDFFKDLVVHQVRKCKLRLEKDFCRARRTTPAG